MECERLKRLVKNWYVQVQDEAMAPARMVDFMRNHLRDCRVCMGDPLVETEVKRITEIVLPASKIPKAVRRENEPDDEEEITEEEEVETDDEVGEDDDEEEDDLDDDDLDDEDMDEDDDDDDDI